MPTAPSVERVRTKKLDPFRSISTDSILTGDLICPGRSNIGFSYSRISGCSSGEAPAAAANERGRDAASAAVPVSFSQSRRGGFFGGGGGRGPRRGGPPPKRVCFPPPP